APGAPRALAGAVSWARRGGAGTLGAGGPPPTPRAEDPAPLRAAAEDRHAGLCPGCLAELPDPLPPLPPPLVLADGRLAGEGYAVEAGGSNGFRTLRIETPERVLKSGPDRPRILGPRGVATLAAGLVLLGAAAAALFVP